MDSLLEKDERRIRQTAELGHLMWVLLTLRLCPRLVHWKCVGDDLYDKVYYVGYKNHSTSCFISLKDMVEVAMKELPNLLITVKYWWVYPCFLHPAGCW